MIKKVRLGDMQESVREFLDEALSGDGVVIEGDAGQLRGRLLAYEQLSAEERERAWRDLQALQVQVQQRLDAAGRTEDELDAILQADE